MARTSASYRPNRRNNAKRKQELRGWDMHYLARDFEPKRKRAVYADLPPRDKKGNVNYQNRADKEDIAKRDKANTIEYAGVGIIGLARMLVDYRQNTVYKKKPKQGTAAKRRKAPLQNFLSGQKLEEAQDRHIHPRSKRGLKGFARNFREHAEKVKAELAK